MKKYIFAVVFFSFLISCNDNEKKSENDQDPLSESTEFDSNSSEQSEREGLERNNNDVDFSENKGIEQDETNPQVDNTSGVAKKNTGSLEGKFRRTEAAENTNVANCSSIEVSFSAPSQLCIVPNDILISAKFRKTGTNSADVFLVEPVKSQNLDREIPWKDFDRNTPIATLELTPNGQMKLDWKGFSINGELATDYAIFGKKALEGTYERE